MGPVVTPVVYLSRMWRVISPRVNVQPEREVSEMSEPAWVGPIELEVDAASDVLAADDDRWLDEVDRFHRELEDQLGRDTVRRETTPQPGMKGGLTSIIVSLGSAGAFTAAAAVFHDWLGRAGDRNITVRIGTQVVKVSGKNVRDDTLVESLRAAMQAGA